MGAAAQGNPASWLGRNRRVVQRYQALVRSAATLGTPSLGGGMDFARAVGLEAVLTFFLVTVIFGTAVDVSSSLIILFTIYGAILQFSGAGKFYLDFSFAALGRKPTGSGRTIVLSSFLLGGPSGSGVATTVTLGTVAYPMLAKAGYESLGELKFEGNMTPAGASDTAFEFALRGRPDTMPISPTVVKRPRLRTRMVRPSSALRPSSPRPPTSP